MIQQMGMNRGVSVGILSATKLTHQHHLTFDDLVANLNLGQTVNLNVFGEIGGQTMCDGAIGEEQNPQDRWQGREINTRLND